MRIVILIVSFILESVISNFFPVNSFFVSLFSLTAIVAIYPLFEDEKRKYFLAAFLLGLAYDLIYTDTIIFHAIIFCFMAFIIIRLNLVLSDNFINALQRFGDTKTHIVFSTNVGPRGVQFQTNA